jgi:hypothetical protein
MDDRSLRSARKLLEHKKGVQDLVHLILEVKFCLENLSN